MHEMKICIKCDIEKSYLNSILKKIHRNIEINVEIVLN